METFLTVYGGDDDENSLQQFADEMIRLEARRSRIGRVDSDVNDDDAASAQLVDDAGIFKDLIAQIVFLAFDEGASLLLTSSDNQLKFA